MAGFFGLLWYVRGRGGDRVVFVEEQRGELGNFLNEMRDLPIPITTKTSLFFFPPRSTFIFFWLRYVVKPIFISIFSCWVGVKLFVLYSFSPLSPL